MRLPNICGLITASALLFGANSANALVLTIEDLNVSGSEVIVNDATMAGGLDTNLSEGSIVYGDIVGGFLVGIATGLGDPFLGGDNPNFAQTILGFLNVTNNTPGNPATTGSLKITLTDDNLTVGTAQTATVGTLARSSFSLTADPTIVTTQMNTFITSAALNVGNPLEVGNFTNDGSDGTDQFKSVSLLPSDVFSLTTEVVLNFTAKAFALGGVELTVSKVPLPAALPLFLSALVGLGLIGRQRRRKAA